MSGDITIKPTARMRELMAADELIVSPGVFDGYSVRLVEKMGYKTACTTGAGLSNSRLGVPDVGIMGLSDNVEACRMIARSVSIPVMADADTGYGTPANLLHTVRLFEDAGVAGINIEDQVSPKRCGHMEGKDVVDPREMARKIEAACDARKDDDFVILARTDAIAVEGLEGAIRRAQLYAKAGADMIFADAIGGEDQIKALVDALRRSGFRKHGVRHPDTADHASHPPQVSCRNRGQARDPSAHAARSRHPGDGVGAGDPQAVDRQRRDHAPARPVGKHRRHLGVDGPARVQAPGSALQQSRRPGSLTEAIAA